MKTVDYREPYTFRQYGIVRRIWRVLYPVLVGFLIMQGIAAIIGFAMGISASMQYMPEMLENGGVLSAEMMEEMTAKMTEDMYTYSIYIQLVSTIAGLAVMLPMWLATRKYRPQIKPGTTRNGLLLTVLFFPGVALILNYILALIGIEMPPEFEQAFEALMSAPLWLQYLTVAIIGPIFEELIFRGVVLARSLYWMPKWLAVAVSSVLFGIWHLNAVQLIYAIPLGILMSLLYIRYRNLLLCIAAHIACNALSVTLNYIGENPTANIIISIVLIVITIVAALPLYGSKRIRLTASAMLIYPEPAEPAYEPIAADVVPVQDADAEVTDASAGTAIAEEISGEVSEKPSDTVE
ncbi:MAG: CPBP family intramembrane metalloprotease [Oscillospiraceae bacterium]|jgi:membrane protease YdiL (CAAX protease family)|nr:CPBP family intramembrane metalloprotease [Oscillospiraceae bacterium]